MEILDAGGGRRGAEQVGGAWRAPATAVPLERGEAPRAAEGDVLEPDLDLAAPAETTGQVAGTGSVWAGLVGPEPFAVAALVLATGQAIAGTSPFAGAVFAAYVSVDSPAEQAELTARSGLMGAAICLVFAVAGLFRLPRARTSWAAGLLGGALLLTLYLFALAAYLLWKAPSLPASY